MAKKIDKIEISDALIERPIGFSFRGRHFSIYPPTLGKIQLISRLVDLLEITKVKGDDAVFRGLLKAAREKRDACLRILAYSTLSGNNCLDEKAVQKRIKRLRRMEDVDLASTVLLALTMDRSEDIMEYFGLDTEAKEMSRVMKAKEKNKNSVAFAGKSVWGTMIDAACERYGWTYQYVLWDISYCALKMLLSDQVKTVYLSDEERKRAMIVTDRTKINADDPEAIERFIKHTSWS